jgi:hypothetical protein
VPPGSAAIQAAGGSQPGFGPLNPLRGELPAAWGSSAASATVEVVRRGAWSAFIGWFVLGGVLASTDPVAVSALGRRLSLPARVQALVQAESLFNDATSLVLYQIAVSIAVAGTAGTTTAGLLLHGAGQFVVLAAGGAAVGSVIAAGVLAVRQRVTDPVLETVVALITPNAAYVLGAAEHDSPVMAVIVAGLAINARRERSPPRRPGCSCTRSTRPSSSCWKAWSSASSGCNCPP